MMDSVQLNRALSRQHTFLGVFPINRLPAIIPKNPASFIANMDSAAQPCSHWVAFYVSVTDRMEFFNLYGHSPESFDGALADYCTGFQHIDYNPLVLQSHVTAVCGQYCIYYLHCKHREMYLKEVLQQFVSNHVCNDLKVYDYVSKYFNVRASFYA